MIKGKSYNRRQNELTRCVGTAVFMRKITPLFVQRHKFSKRGPLPHSILSVCSQRSQELRHAIVWGGGVGANWVA